MYLLECYFIKKRIKQSNENGGKLNYRKTSTAPKLIVNNRM